MLLPRYRPDQPAPLEPKPRRHLNDKLRQITRRDTDTTITVQAGAPPDHIERMQRRGIPIIGGVTGTQPGSDPLLEVLRNENRRRYGAAA